MNARELFEDIKRFLDFGPDDVEALRSISGWVADHGPAITDAFYETIQRTPAVAGFVEGRVEHLKKTHIAWMRELVGGEYGDAYFASRWKIGLAHVRIGLDPIWVDGTMSLIRSKALVALAEHAEDKERLTRAQASLVKACDLDLAIINLAYAEDRLDRLTEFTGMKRPLIENIIKLPRKA